MLLQSVILSIVVGYIRGGKLSHFENLTIKLWYFISVAFLVQIIALRMPHINDSIFYILHMLSYVIIVYICILNRKILSIVVMGLGTLLNMIVIGANAGQMPVKVPDNIIDPIFDRGHSLMTQASHIPILGDIFLIEFPFIGGGMFSIGDVVLAIGAFLFIQYVMKDKFNGQIVTSN